MTPALTPEEWKSYPDWPHALPHYANELPLYYPRRHGIAAANLHNQPFGFTREDVELLRAEETSCPEWGSSRIRDTALWKSLADRIEALLPPEE